MKDSINNKLKNLVKRYEEIDLLLLDSNVADNIGNYKSLLKERSELNDIVFLFEKYNLLEKNIKELEVSFKEQQDNEIKSLFEDEIKLLNNEKESLVNLIYDFFIKKNISNIKNIFVEIRAGTGGNEASLFVRDLVRMYMMYSESNNWNFEIINFHSCEFGGYKEIVLRIVGKMVYDKLSFESGVHRVQRIPETESQGRLHTSTCSVVVMPETEIMENVTINVNDIRIDTYRASGAGGQHVNKTDSAVRITHIPTNIVVECQQERSQHKNKSRALSLLHAKILNREQNLQKVKIDDTRKKIVGTCERSERIRTYNYPQNRITDHRINLSVYKLNYILDGNLDILILPLQKEFID